MSWIQRLHARNTKANVSLTVIATAVKLKRRRTLML